MAVMSLVQEAVHMGVSSDSGLVDSGEAESTECVPKHDEYVIPCVAFGNQFFGNLLFSW
jgi:hypothetical protein